MKNFKPNGERARLAILFTWLLLAVEAVSLVSSFLKFRLLQQAQTGSVTDAAIAAVDVREGLVTVLYMIVWITWIVTFLMWFYRARANLQTKLPYGLSCSPGRAVGNFFIPIICLFRPYQNMKELYEDTRELFADGGMTETTALKTDYLGGWWGLWIVSAIISNIVGRVGLRGGSETLESLVGLTVTEIIGNVVGIALALVVVIVVRDYSRVEPLLADKPDMPIEAE